MTAIRKDAIEWMQRSSCRNGCRRAGLAMSKQIERCAKTVSTLCADIELTNQVYAIFAAPEYYFTVPATTRTALTTAQKHRLYLKLVAPNPKYPKVLMIPGNIISKEEINTEVAHTKMTSHRLMSEITAKSTLAKPDYVVLSAWTSNSETNMAMAKGGHVLHAFSN